MQRVALFGATFIWIVLQLGIGAVPMASAKGLVFTPESLQEFSRALQVGRRAVLDRQHTDGTRYHAYRFLDRDMVLIGVAKAITIDAAGRVNIVQAHGQPMGGHLNTTHREYSHVLVPIDVTPP